jgi:protein-S-isoprenylcysteine O-methyltransferase Ste14
MARAIRFLFGVAAYLFFFATFLYLIGFVTNMAVPRSVDIGDVTSPLNAVAINLLLFILFGVQHSVMARPEFKRALGRFWPEGIERSLYVAATSIVLVVFFWQWRPIPEPLWSVADSTVRAVILTLSGAGWLIVLVSTFLLNHFELFGLRQIWLDWNGRKMPESQFRQPLFYRFVRHPIYTGFLIAFWATPDMSVGHLLFAIGMTAYILIGIRYEERDLKENLGDAYTVYSQNVGMIIPGLGKSKP